VSAHPTQASPAVPAIGGPAMRVSDADRDAAASVLNAAFAEGRLTVDEHGQRVEAACAARTWQQLHQLTADLPAPRAAAEPMAPTGFTAPGLCLLCVLLCLCPPAGIAWWLLSRRRPETGLDAQLTPVGVPAEAGEPHQGGPGRCC
jgi:Domain of unknown function (DUF1707)